MLINRPSRSLAIAEALVANSFWASTPVLIKIGLNDAGPLTLGGLRYFGAFVLLLPFILPNRAVYARLTPGLWLRLAILGFSAYTLGNGALFWGLQYMSATTGSFELSLAPILVLFIAIPWLHEIPTRLQLSGIVVVVIGSGLFFSPGLGEGEPLALAVVAAGLLGFALSGVVGRELARDRTADTLLLTAVPLAFGGGLVLVLGVIVEGVPGFTVTTLVVVVWLAVFNTCLAYLLYNHSLQVLTALEVNVMMNLAPLATAGIAAVLLGEQLQPVQVPGMLIVIGGVLLVQWKRTSN